MKIRDLMTRDAYSCRTTDTIEDVVRQLAEHKVSGLPIVDDRGKVAGFISDGDIMKSIAKRPVRLIYWAESMPVIAADDPLEQKLAELRTTNVMQLATRRIVAVDIDDEVDEVADILGQKRIKKAPVLENGKFVGVISRTDIIRHVMEIFVSHRD